MAGTTVVIRTYEEARLIIRNYESVICKYELVIRTFELVIRNYELVIRNFELVIRNYEFLIRNYELVIRNYELVIRNFTNYQNNEFDRCRGNTWTMCEFHDSNGNGLGDIWWTNKLIYFSIRPIDVKIASKSQDMKT